MVWNWLYFILGAVGALAPEVIRLYKLATDKGQFTWTPFYVVISLLFGGIGGLIAVILPATNPIGAIYAGVAWPALVTAGARVVGSGQDGQQKGDDTPAGPQTPSFRSFIRAL